MWADHLVCWWGWGCSQSSNLLFSLLCYWDQHIPSLESGHWSRWWWVGCGWPVDECVVTGLCLVGSSSWSLWSLYLERWPWWQGTHCLPLISRPPQQVFWTGVTIPPLSRSALSCQKSSYPLMVKRWASVRWVSWMQMMSTPSLFRNSCSSGFFFRSPSVFHCAKTTRTADISGWLDKHFTCCLLFFSWFALPVTAGGPLWLVWGWGPGTVTAWCSTRRAPYRRMSVCMAMLGKVRSDWSSPDLVTLQEVCPLSSEITSNFWAAHGLSLSVLLLDWWPAQTIESNLPDQLPLAGNTLGRWVTWTSSTLAVGYV